MEVVVYANRHSMIRGIHNYWKAINAKGKSIYAAQATAMCVSSIDSEDDAPQSRIFLHRDMLHAGVVAHEILHFALYTVTQFHGALVLDSKKMSKNGDNGDARKIEEHVASLIERAVSDVGHWISAGFPDEMPGDTQ